MEGKKLKRNRMLTCFIDAATEIIEKEGINGVTIRKVASISGYNSATIYNYFENLNHLIFLASMKFIRPYTENLSNYIKDSKNALDKTLSVWECFCHYSFKNPEIYYFIFFTKLNNSINNYIKEYYEIYPQELISSNQNITTMLLKHNIYDRSLILLEECVKEGFINKKDIFEINEMFMFIYKGMLSKIMEKEIDDSIDNLVSKTIKYIKICFNGYLDNQFQCKLS
ncbi:TetR/AcrR family transcriptional regulator [Tepidibacter thalassicus]|uniref:Transcriptional regulator, TetR family n=1 Tax=Tepidibacter thalassicus DSM 15285 TaxID=1123350 RepID=A0A1M5SG75_9FIRM|nr:TetR/AcrR family transcriptional regulator [Tepidibacter thalassicus]SHH37526.1 transcriptional regulator, TetR family [Tepidibacter thalassicus DSM 15285]